MAVDIRIPLSPICGMVDTVGDASHPAFCQLTSPTKSLRIYEIRLGFAGAMTNRALMQRTATPTTLAGVITTGQLIRMDENDATAITATLKGAASTPGITPANAFWADRLSIDTNGGYQEAQIIRPWSFPLILKAGSALEFCSGDNSATQHARIFVIFDEV